MKPPTPIASMRRRMLQRALASRQSSIRAVTQRVEAVGGINLGQGTCALDPHPSVVEAARRAVADGKNSYSMYSGIPRLREAVAQRYNTYNRLPVSAANI